MYPINIAIYIVNRQLWEDVDACLLTLPVRVVLDAAAVAEPYGFLDKVARCAPDVVILEASVFEERFQEVVQQLLSLPSKPEVIAVSTTASAEEILNAVRAGAREFIQPPCAHPLSHALARFSDERHSRAERTGTLGRAIGVVSAKGGLGATTVACHAAAELQRRSGLSTLIVDLDLSSGHVRSMIRTSSNYSVLDACSNVYRLDESLWQSFVGKGHDGKLDVLGAPVETDVPEPPARAHVSHLLKFAKTQYPWVIADLGHGRTSVLSAALDELDDLLVVTTAEVPALQQLQRFLHGARKRQISPGKIKIVANRVVRRADTTVPELEKILGMRVFATIANDYRSLVEASAEGRLLAPDAPVCMQIGDMIGSLVGLEKPPEPGSKSFLSSFF